MLWPSGLFMLLLTLLVFFFFLSKFPSRRRFCMVSSREMNWFLSSLSYSSSSLSASSRIRTSDSSLMITSYSFRTSFSCVQFIPFRSEEYLLNSTFRLKSHSLKNSKVFLLYQIVHGNSFLFT